MKPRFSVSGIGCALFTSCLIPATNLAAEQTSKSGDASGDFHYSVSAGATHSDNVGHTRVNQVSETSAEVGLAAGIEYEHLRTTATVDADLQYRMHNSSSYGNELAGGLAASARYQFKRNFSWMAQDNLTQSLINAQNTATPGNTQSVNMFSTGPDLRLPLSSRTSVNIQSRWSDVSYGESGFDSRRLSATLGVQRKTGAHTTVSLNGSTDHVGYKDLPSSNDFNTHLAYLGWNATGAHTTLDVTAGYTGIDGKLGDSSGGGSYGLEVTRKTTARSALLLNAGRSFGDASDALRRDQGIGGVSSDGRPTSISAGPLKSDYARVSWNVTGNRSSLGLSANWLREESKRDASLDRNSIGGSLNVARRVGERLSFNFFSNYARDEFDTTSVRSNEWSTGIGMNWSFTPAIGVGANWAHLVGSGDTTLGAGTRDYIENRYTVRLAWSPRR